MELSKLEIMRVVQPTGRVVEAITCPLCEGRAEIEAAWQDEVYPCTACGAEGFILVKYQQSPLYTLTKAQSN